MTAMGSFSSWLIVCKFTKKGLNCKCFPVHFEKYFRISFLQNNSFFKTTASVITILHIWFVNPILAGNLVPLHFDGMEGGKNVLPLNIHPPDFKLCAKVYTNKNL